MQESASSTTDSVTNLDDLVIVFCEEKPWQVIVLDKVGREGVTERWLLQNCCSVVSVTGSRIDRVARAKPTRRASWSSESNAGAPRLSSFCETAAMDKSNFNQRKISALEAPPLATVASFMASFDFIWGWVIGSTRNL